jgi:DNA-binding NtrC family response regulator
VLPEDNSGSGRARHAEGVTKTFGVQPQAEVASAFRRHKGRGVEDQAEDIDAPRVGRGLLEAVCQALQGLADDGDDAKALRESFSRATVGVGGQRSFLARVGPDRTVTEVLLAEGLSADHVEALRSGKSSPGVSPSVIRAALETGEIQLVEDSRLARTDADTTGSLAGGEYSVICAPVSDPHTNAPFAVLYFQTSSVGQPLTQAHAPFVFSYARALSLSWTGWMRSQRELAVARAQVHTGREVEIIGESEETRALRSRLNRFFVRAMAAPRPDPILITGPTGTGKDLVARYLHAFSARAKGRFVALNCATFKGDVIESVLFGHAKGAFTGAQNANEGLFLAANNGVLFLDEVGDMPGEGQRLLLRALETRSVRPVGGRDEVPVDVQIVCATNRDLPALVAAKKFREDVYHRIRGLQIKLTPLSGRPTDILPLLSYFIAHHERRVGRRTLGLSPEALTLLLAYAWPGNVRELSAVTSALVLHAEDGEPITEDTLRDAVPEVHEAARSSDASVDPEVVAEGINGAKPFFEAVEMFERAYLLRAGNALNWHKSRMSEQLKLDRKGLYMRLKRYGLMGANDEAEES